MKITKTTKREDSNYKRKQNFKKEITVMEGTSFEKTFVIPGRFQDRRKAEQEMRSYVRSATKQDKKNEDSLLVSKLINSDRRYEKTYTVRLAKKETVYITLAKFATDKYLSIIGDDCLEDVMKFYELHGNNEFIKEIYLCDIVAIIKNKRLNGSNS